MTDNDRDLLIRRILVDLDTVFRQELFKDQNMYPHKFVTEIEKRYRSLSFITRLLSYVKNVILKPEPCKRPVMSAEGVEPETRRFGYEMCRDSIGGVWGQVLEDKLRIVKLSGGLTNYLYICSLSDDVQVPDNQPRKVLLRVYGDIATSSSFLVQNSVIFALMSEKGLGPKLYGMNSRGRIEEFIPTRCLSTHELSEPWLSTMIAQKLARFHSLDMPLCKEPRFITDQMDKWIVDVENSLKRNRSKKDVRYVNKLRNFHLSQELKILKKILSTVNSPIVFSHNDLQEGNILYSEKCSNPDQILTVIDWEYCSYNYRGYDFGNHFVEWCYDYSVTEEPCFSHTRENFPSKTQQYHFFTSYLTTTGEEITDSILSEMYREANIFASVSHFFWGLWGVLQNDMSTINFGFMEYADSRISEYFYMKERLKQEGLIE